MISARYEPSVEGDCLELLRLALGDSFGSPRTEPFWRWKHVRNPFGASEGLCARDPHSHGLVGLRLFMRWKLRTRDGRLVSAARAVDTATHPGYRRRGIFAGLTARALTQLAESGVELVFNTPNRQSLPGYLALGWGREPDRPLCFRILRPAKFARRMFRPPQPSEGVPAWESCFGPEVLRWKEFTERFGEEVRSVTEAWEAGRRQVGHRTPRSLDYLDWRYGGHPPLAYGVVAVTDESGLAAYAILRPNRRYGVRETLVAEIALREPRLSLGRRLLREARRRVRADWMLAHAAPGTLERRMLWLSGYHPWPGHAIAFTARAVSNPRGIGDLPREWDLSLGDLEIF